MSSVLDLIGNASGLLLTIPITLLVIAWRKPIHRHENTVYLVALGFVGCILLNARYDVIRQEVFLSITSGGMSFALFYLVMLTGAFNRGSKPYIIFMQVRREMALIGFIFLIPHASTRLNLALNGYNFTGLIAFIIMVPLVITSYPLIRKQLSRQRWLQVHKMAYIVYLMIYIHLGFTLIAFNGLQVSYAEDSLLYHIAFLVYLFMKSKNRIYPKIKSA
ncbi:MAG: ferric reductase-like transmembrane domain-containing protein [Candidatus Izemoplasma sp.]|nr:ferric reductase-like transmembrane domain-containing protein [Candidatus Izemoplasma sp.]